MVNSCIILKAVLLSLVAFVATVSVATNPASATDEQQQHQQQQQQRSKRATESSSKLGKREFVLSAHDRKQIEDVIDSTMRCSHMAGLAMSIVTLKDGVLMERGFGLANISAGSKVTEHTLFPIASTTKAFTSTLLAILMDKHKNLESRFDWNTPVKKLLGESFALHDNLLTCQVTIEDLLAHRTGIPDYLLLLMAPYPEGYTRKQLVHDIRYHKPEVPFRTHFIYNNHMYALAGHVAEVLEGKSWEDLTRSHLFEPLSMNKTKFVSEALKFPDEMAASYDVVDGDYRPVDIEFLRQVILAGPAGSMVSTAHDMSKWMQFQLSSGQQTYDGGKRIFTDPQRLMDTYIEQNVASARHLNDRDFVRPHSPVSDVHTGYSLGWFTNYYRGYKRLWHSGGISTYHTQVWLYPDMEFGIFAVANTDTTSSFGLKNIMYFISDILLGEQPWLNATSIQHECSANTAFSATSRGDSNLPKDTRPRPAYDYPGVYVHPGFGNVTVTYDSERNALRLSMGRFITADLHYSRSDDTFYTAYDSVAWLSRFRTPVRFGDSDADGDVDVLQMSLGSPRDTKNMVSFVKTNGKPPTAFGHDHYGQPSVSAELESCICDHPNIQASSSNTNWGPFIGCTTLLLSCAPLVLSCFQLQLGNFLWPYSV